MTKRILIPIADGTEDLEAVALVDVLRRSGADVTVASVGGLTVKCAKGVQITADHALSDCVSEQYDLIVLPGGSKGAEHLRDNAQLTSMLKAQRDSGRLYGAICASPAVVLEHHGLLAGKKATAYPGYESKLKDPSRAHERVVIDGSCVTSQGPGTAVEFGLVLIEQLFGKAKRTEIERQIIF